MGITFDSSVNSMIQQAQARGQSSLQSTAQMRMTRDLYATQESAVMTLIRGAHLQTYSRAGVMQNAANRGRYVEAIG